MSYKKLMRKVWYEIKIEFRKQLKLEIIE